MKLKRFLLRYFPPGIILEYESGQELKQKTIDLLSLNVECVPLSDPPAQPPALILC